MQLFNTRLVEFFSFAFYKFFFLTFHLYFFLFVRYWGINVTCASLFNPGLNAWNIVTDCFAGTSVTEAIREKVHVCARPVGYSVACQLNNYIQWVPNVWVINANASVLHIKNEYNNFHYISGDLEFECDVELKQHETRMSFEPLCKSSVAKASKCHLNFSSKMSIFQFMFSYFTLKTYIIAFTAYFSRKIYIFK